MSTATFNAEGSRVSLIDVVPGRGLFSKPRQQAVPVNDWALCRPDFASSAVALIFQALEDGADGHDGTPLVSAAADSVILNQDFIAKLADCDARALGLPATTELTLDLRSIGLIHRDDFRIEHAWIRNGSIPVRARMQDGWLKADGRTWRVPDPLHNILRLVSEVNGAADEEGRQSAIANFKAELDSADGMQIRSDGVIDRLRIAYASAFSLDLKDTPNGPDFDPILFGSQQLASSVEGFMVDQEADALLPPSLAPGFIRRFRNSDGKRRSYLLDDGSLLFIDPAVAMALHQVRKAMAAPSDQRRAFASAPRQRAGARRSEVSEERIRETADVSRCFIETEQFAQRVAGVDIWRQPVFPWIRSTPGRSAPDAFGLRIGEPPAARSIELTDGNVARALDATVAALQGGCAHFELMGHMLPATQATKRALTSLAALAAVKAQNPQGDLADLPASLAQGWFLHVGGDADTLSAAPLLQGIHAPQEVAPERFPDGFRTQAKRHQLEGFRWLTSLWLSGRPGALLADEFGLGKSLQALGLVAWLSNRQDASGPVLIVAPPNLLDAWKSEIERHLAWGTRTHLIRQSGEYPDGGLADDGAIVLTTYDVLRDEPTIIARERFSAAIFDEAQHLRHPGTQVTRAAKSLDARLKLAITATPVVERLLDVWSILDAVCAGGFGTRDEFSAKYSSQSDASSALHEFLATGDETRPPLMLKRFWADCGDDLAAPTVRHVPVKMPPVQANTYERAVRRALALKGSDEFSRLRDALHRLSALSLCPLDIEQLAKSEGFAKCSARIIATMETLQQISIRGEKVLVFCEDASTQALLADEIRHHFALPHAIPRVHESLPESKRRAAIEAFRERGPGFDALIVQSNTSCRGWSLAQANNVIHLSQALGLNSLEAVTGILDPIGQKREVTHYIPQAIHPEPAISAISFDRCARSRHERMRKAAHSQFLANVDEKELKAFFDEVVSDAIETVASEAKVIESPDDGFDAEIGASRQRQIPRRILSVRGLHRPRNHPPPCVAVVREWPRRVVYEEGGLRDRTIFTAPVEGDGVRNLSIIDPYGGAGERARRLMIDFARMLLKDGRGAEPVHLKTFDAESVNLNYREDSNFQYNHMLQCWQNAFGSEVALNYSQISKRSNRSFHDREVRVITHSGRSLIWDIGRGIEGVMNARYQCTVVLTEE